jgi:hypothetical protein
MSGRKRVTIKEFFTVVFYGSTIFCCKTAQFSETPRESVCSGLALKNRLRTSRKPAQKLVRQLQISRSDQMSDAGKKCAAYV